MAHGSYSMGFSGGSDGKESVCNEGHLGLMPGSGRSPGEGNGSPLQLPGELHGQRSLVGYIPHGITDSWTRLSDTHTFNAPSPGGSVVKNLPGNGAGKIPWRKKWQPTPVFLPGKSHGQKSPVGQKGSQRIRHDLSISKKVIQ